MDRFIDSQLQKDRATGLGRSDIVIVAANLSMCVCRISQKKIDNDQH